MFSLVSRWNGFFTRVKPWSGFWHAPNGNHFIAFEGFQKRSFAFNDLKTLSNKYHANSKTKIILFLDEKVNDLIQEHSPEKTAENWAN